VNPAGAESAGLPVAVTKYAERIQSAPSKAGCRFHVTAEFFEDGHLRRQHVAHLGIDRHLPTEVG
jgi:hypothetical protein